MAAAAHIMNLAVIIPTLNACRTLPATLASIGSGTAVIVADGGSMDGTIEAATTWGAQMVKAPAGRGSQLTAGAAIAPATWLLFLHSDTVLEPAWRQEVERFTADPDNAERAAVFRFAVDDASAAARQLERRVAWRARRLGLPYGDQGLLIHRDFYKRLGGFRPWPLMEDVDLIRRIGPRRLTVLQSAARTSAERWRRDGWRRRSIRNLFCLSLYFLGVPPSLIARLYG
jgi:rSAM/selenodomain-associated transferase 2